MNYTQSRGWAPWEVAGEHGNYVGGYRTQYNNGLVFATVRGAGRELPRSRAALKGRAICARLTPRPSPAPASRADMVPAMRPEAALELFKRAVLGKGF